MRQGVSQIVRMLCGIAKYEAEYGSGFASVKQFVSSLAFTFLLGLSHLLGPKLFFVTGLVIFVTAVARLVCPDMLG